MSEKNSWFPKSLKKIAGSEGATKKITCLASALKKIPRHDQKSQPPDYQMAVPLVARMG